RRDAVLLLPFTVSASTQIEATLAVASQCSISNGRAAPAAFAKRTLIPPGPASAKMSLALAAVRRTSTGNDATSAATLAPVPVVLTVMSLYFGQVARLCADTDDAAASKSPSASFLAFMC